MSATILAIRLGDERLLANGAVDTGLLPLLSVQRIVGKVQSTVFYGNSLYLMGHDVGILTPETAFTKFCMVRKGIPANWAQIATIPPNPVRHSIYLVPQPPPEPPAAEGCMTVLNAGYDPNNGYFIEFAGNFWLHIPIFLDFGNITRVFQ